MGLGPETFKWKDQAQPNETSGFVSKAARRAAETGLPAVKKKLSQSQG